MVVLAASIVSKSGKALVSRQYMEMSRIRIEGLLAAFPKLVGTGKQHTYVETENVRYVYQPMEGIYLLLVTNKQSNILEDLDTLRLLAKLVPEYAQSLEEEAICRNAFELVFAFDEVISLGIRDNVTVTQVKQNCEMESHEEKLHKMLIQSKINDTKDLMKRKAMEIEKTKIDQQKGLGTSGFMGRAGGFGGTPSPLSSGPAESGLDAPQFSRPAAPAATKPSGVGPARGMKLGAKKNDLLDSLAKEGEVFDLPPSAGGAYSAADHHSAAPPTEPVSLNIDEKLNVTISKEGAIEAAEVQGTLSLVVHADEFAHLRVALSSGPNKAFQFKTHPNIDKATYSSANVLGLKDPSRPFPTGSELGVLKWFCKTQDEAFVPLTINCWPSLSGAQSYVNVEYESSATYDLQNVVIAIPVPSGQSPNVTQVDGDWRYDSRRGVVLWTVDLIDDTNRSGALEFVTPASDSDSFFPIDIGFSATQTFCEVEVATVEHTQTHAPVKFSSVRLLQTAQYQVV